MKQWMLAGGLLMGLSSGLLAAPVDGQWYLQDAGTTQDKLDAAVDSVAKEMNFFVRMVARPILEKEARICHQWQLATQTTQWQWQCDEEQAETIPLTANRFKTIGDDDRDIFATFHQTSNQVDVILESERGKRTNTWKRLDANTLEYTAKLESEKLPKPLTWTLTYTHTKP
ncbi:hypothetical protein [Marinomonas pollencensis]|uniref:Lipocalin-like protein n=1 Tax=Marinomonas pollencensis TaxID=491954 RepID=A0A3E0DE78_9GAMM|nr:hypothetical protein [Marinomonas pollencensis]REG81010.1 hypothetical protein DFP81_11718 [Marinomonas pollencensis]